MHTYIVLVNWRNPYDTIECLESLLRLDDQDFTVLVCDNGSNDGSLSIFEQWSQRTLLPAIPVGAIGRQVAFPPYAKEFKAVFCTTEIECGSYQVQPKWRDAIGTAKIAFIQIPENLGFAGGNNVALRFALSIEVDCAIWLLNNDTVVEPDTLGRLREKLTKMPAASIVAPTIKHYCLPSEVQYLGGAIYRRWFGTVRPIVRLPGGLVASSGERNERIVERRMSYPSGASMFFNSSLIRKVGLLSESYFLYFEELDFVSRCSPGLALGYVSAAIVYHKEGAAAGGGISKKARKSATSEFYSARSRALYSRRFAPWCVATVVLSALLAILRRFLRGDLVNGAAAWRGLVSGLKAPIC